MGLFDKFKAGLQKTQDRLNHEIKRIVTGSRRLTGEDLEELEALLIGADFGLPIAREIVASIKVAYETQGPEKTSVPAVAAREVARNLTAAPLHKEASALTVVSIVGVNGTGKTTSTAKLAHYLQAQGESPLIAACDTFRAAAIEQLKIWGERLKVPVISSAYGADPAAVAHDAISAAISRQADYLLVDTAGRLHTKQNLMQELEKLHRVMGKKLPGAPHETLLILDATTGMNALSQARVFHKAVPLTGLVITKLDGTSKGGMVAAVHRDLGLPIKFAGVGEQADDLQPFDPGQFARALFGIGEKE